MDTQYTYLSDGGEISQWKPINCASGGVKGFDSGERSLGGGSLVYDNQVMG